MACLTRSTLSGVQADRRRPRGSLSFIDPYLCLFDTNSIRLLRLGASRLWNWCRKPSIKVFGHILYMTLNYMQHSSKIQQSKLIQSVNTQHESNKFREQFKWSKL